MKTIFLGIVFCFAAAAAFAQTGAPQGNAQTGKTLFTGKGCYSCHGFVGQGSREGPRLTPPMAYPAFVAQLRTPRLIMPPYTAALVTDGEAADIFAYLANLPTPPDPKSIDLLK
jgi:mono/diheme cytochrome c family protein